MTLGEALDRVESHADRLHEALGRILNATDADVPEVQRRAMRVLLDHCGDAVHTRGLVEFSNVCACDCHYCGIRAGNRSVERFTLTRDDILDAARFCSANGYGSIVLQAGQRCDPAFTGFVSDALAAIKQETRSDALPDGIGITLCVGEQSAETYARFRAAGAHRYLLRIETSHPLLFAQLHPASQGFDARVECLHVLRREGFQVGTGVMIGIPGQTVEMLVADLLFFRDMDIDMIGMGPYIPHRDTPTGRLGRREWTDRSAYRTSLLMIAAARLLLRDVNIAATTALQAMNPFGREHGLESGANVIMPTLTPKAYRGKYLLYEGKPCVDEGREDCGACIAARVTSIGRRMCRDTWGDAPHFARRTAAGH